MQNLARERARDFGREDAISSDPSPSAQRTALSTPSSPAFVTTTAADALGKNRAVMDPEEVEDSRMKPRGFFADQFEVRFEGLRPVFQSFLVVLC